MYRLERILIIDCDSEYAEKVKLYLSAISKVSEIDILTSGVEFFKYFLAKNYSMVILDYLLEDIDGLQILLEIKEKQIDLPVIILTGSGDESVAIDCFLNGAIDYIIKDFVNFETLPARIMDDFDKYVQRKTIEEGYKNLKQENKNMKSDLQSLEQQIAELHPAYELLNSEYNKLKESIYRSESFYLSTMYTFSLVLDAKNNLAKGHSERIASLARSIGQQLQLDSEILKNITIAALLHSISYFPPTHNLLLIKNELTAQEQKDIQKHCASSSEKIDRQKDLSSLGRILLYHHERHDGSGYPYGLKDDEIPIESRILNIADTFEALINEGLSEKKIRPDEASKLITTKAGSYFDPIIIKAFKNSYTKVVK